MKPYRSHIACRIKDVVKTIDPTADVILYGSRARGDNNPDSDWDILILVEREVDIAYERIFRHRLYDLELETGEAFSITVHNKSDWESKYWMTPLYENILREGKRI